MKIDIDRYLSTLLSFSPNQGSTKRFGGDYISLIHVPITGPECALSVAMGEEANFLTVARYGDTVWKYLEDCGADEVVDVKPRVNVVKAAVGSDHPVFEYLGLNQLQRCENRSDGCSGMDYYLLMWQKDGYASVAECWEPYGRDDEPWTTVIGAMEVLASQFEHVALSA